MAMLFHLGIIYCYATMAELNSYNRNHMTCKTLNIYYLIL